MGLSVFALLPKFPPPKKSPDNHKKSAYWVDFPEK